MVLAKLTSFFPKPQLQKCGPKVCARMSKLDTASFSISSTIATSITFWEVASCNIFLTTGVEIQDTRQVMFFGLLSSATESIRVKVKSYYFHTISKCILLMIYLKWQQKQSCNPVHFPHPTIDTLYRPGHKTSGQKRQTAQICKRYSRNNVLRLM